MYGTPMAWTAQVRRKTGASFRVADDLTTFGNGVEAQSVAA